MKRLRLLTVTAVIVFALGAIAATAASAEAPEILPAPTEKAPDTFTTANQNETNILETELSKVTCKTDTSQGQFTSSNLGTLSLDLTGCGENKNRCNSKGDAEGTVLVPVADINLVDILPAKVLALGLEILPLTEGKNEFKLECGKVKIVIKGSIIGEFLGLKVEEGKPLVLSLFETATLDFNETKGNQAVTKCDHPLPLCEKELKLTTDFGLGPEKSGEQTTQKLTNISPKKVHIDY